MKNNTQVILIVEDEPAILDSYAEILEGGGFSSLKAADGYKGLDILATNKDVVDLILLDLMMPQMDGLDVLKQIRENPSKYGEAPVIVLTNLSSERVIREAFERGANGYLMKTELEPDQVVSEIKTVLKTSPASQGSQHTM
ncbi:MAG: response regulator [Candidatus Dojkabacteria bacterium]|nr:response regulator [Candidatus Dojkabacteria bacterium]